MYIYIIILYPLYTSFTIFSSHIFKQTHLSVTRFWGYIPTNHPMVMLKIQNRTLTNT